MKIRVPKLTAENCFTFFLVIYWGRDIVFNYVKAILARIPVVSYFAEYMIPFIMFVFLLLSFPYLAKTIFPVDIVFTGAVLVVFLWNIILFPENESLAALSVTFFASVFPLYFIGLRCESSKHIQPLYIMSIINIWTFFAYYILIGSSSLDSAQGEYGSYMGRAYILLPQLLIVIYGFLRKKDILNIVTMIIGTILLLMCGNRGSVLITLFFLLFYLLFNTSKKRRVSGYVGAISLFGILVYYYNHLIKVMTRLFVNLGMSIRVFERLSNESFFDSNGRNVIVDKLKTAISNNPIIGYGLCSDRTITGSYAHNYAYELWTAFGVILGSLFLIATIYVIFKSWIEAKNVENRGVLLVLICVGFLKLFISSSFLLEGLFFMLIGYGVKLLRMNKFEAVETKGNIDENL